MFYRVGLPFWKTFARIFKKTQFRVEVIFDKDAKVFVAKSPDLKGFVVESDTVEGLIKESNAVAQMLLEEYLDNTNTTANTVYVNLDHAVINA